MRLLRSRAMGVTLIGLHGFTLNGAVMRSMIAPLVAKLPASVTILCPDGPNVCKDSSVARLQQLFGREHNPPPNLCWFDASDDGRTYHGFDRGKQVLTDLIAARSEPVGLLGFSQGAIGAAALAVLSQHGLFPPLSFVVLIAGRTPRSDEVTPYLETPITVPSLHVWGERDQVAKPHVEALVERFEPSTCEVAAWDGPHTIPTRGPGADAIVDFVTRHTARLALPG